MLKTLESTGQKLEEMTSQQVFDFVGEYLFSQEDISVIEGTNDCVYEAYDGNRCAVGICLTEEQLSLVKEYGLNEEGLEKIIVDIHNGNTVQQEKCDVTGLRRRQTILEYLQNVHDNNDDRSISKEYLTVELTKTAKNCKLTTDNLSHLFVEMV